MCLAAIAIGQSKRWPLIIASNRDEFFDRPALPLMRWQSASGQTIVSGRDLKAGGSWFGLTPLGRVALLTNVREPQADAPKAALLSRGALVMDWLEGGMDVSDFMTNTDSAAYAGFNMLVGNFQSNSWHWISNRQEPSLAQKAANGWAFKTLIPGIYGLSNAALDTPWPKTQALKARLSEAIKRNQTADTAAFEGRQIKNQLWAALADPTQAKREALPATGLSLELELALSSAFIDQPAHGRAGYGTRVSTLLAVQSAATAGSWDVSIEEKTYLTQTTPSLVRCNLQWLD
jgi:uncharacterized protein with NRDE domain